MPVSVLQKGVNIGLMTGLTNAWKWSTIESFSVFTSTAGNSMISCLKNIVSFEVKSINLMSEA